MSTVTTIGLDLAKNVFQVHGVDEHGDTVIRRQLQRTAMSAFAVVTTALPPKADERARMPL